MAISTNIMNKTIKTFYINLPLISLISKKPTSLKTPEMEYEKKSVTKEKRTNKGEIKWQRNDVSVWLLFV